MYLDQADLVEAQLRLFRQRLFPAELGQSTLSAGDVQRQTAAARATGIELPLIDLFEAVGLSANEVQVLWLLVAHELCPIVRRGLRELATEQVPDVTIDVVRRLVYGERPSADAWSELAEDGALRRWKLVVMSAAEPGASYRRVISVAPRVLALTHGQRAVDGEIAELVSAGRVADLEALEVDEAAVRAAREALGRDRGLVIVAGAPGTGRRSLLVASARAQQRAVLEIDTRKLSTDARELREQLRAIRRECRLFRCIPLFRDLDALASSHEVDRIGLLETELPELVLATARQPIRRRWSSPPATIELGALTSLQRARLWAGAIPMASSGDAEVMATLYPLAPALIHVAGRAALRRCGDGELQAAHIADGVRSVLDDRLAGLATRLHVTQSWDDLVLPDDQTTAIIELLARIRERGRVYEDWGFAEKVGKGLGISALFSGPPGTGKSMAAGSMRLSGEDSPFTCGSPCPRSTSANGCGKP